MKKTIIACSILLIAISLKSQMVSDWTTPIAMTDTLSFNSKPVVFSLDYGSGDFYIIYEKRLNQTGPRQIWWKNLSVPTLEEQMLIGGWPEVDYRNPQILPPFLFFESNPNGNYDLFEVKLDENGLAGNIIQLTNTEFDENSFFIDYYCCWENEGNIITANYQYSLDSILLTNIETVDTANCHDPLLNGNFIFWRKIENNESHIYYSEKTWPNYQWSDPDTVIHTNDNINLSLSTSVIYWGVNGYHLCWQAADKIFFTGLYDIVYQISSPEILGVESYYEPTAFNLVMFTDNIPELYSFTWQTGSERDIYIVDEYFTGYVLNITNDEHINKNPRLFCGWTMDNYYQIINIWQTEINGYDVLFESSAVYIALGGIYENQENQLNVFPNPVKDEAIVQFNVNEAMKSSIEITIFNNFGIKVDEFKIQNQPTHGNKVTWNKGNLPAGVYYLVVKTKNEIITEKFIIL